MKIGGALPLSGKPHDGRAPDYDDWQLNGDIIVYYPVDDISLELSSMGIRVDEDSLKSQLEKAGFTNVRVDKVNDDEVPENYVIKQNIVLNCVYVW